MSTTTTPILSLPHRLETPIEIGLRTVVALSMCFFAYNAIHQWLRDPTRLTLIGAVIAASLTVGLTLFSRVPRQRDWHPLSLIVTVLGTYYYVIFQLTNSVRLAPEWVGVTLQFAGILWQIASKLSLQRSFGLLPANRGVVSSGAYGLIRHPIYLSYLLCDIGFLIENFCLRNALTVAFLLVLQIGRMYREEMCLNQDPAYRAYCKRVRFRLVPGIF